MSGVHESQDYQHTLFSSFSARRTCVEQMVARPSDEYWINQEASWYGYQRFDWQLINWCLFHNRLVTKGRMDQGAKTASFLAINCLQAHQAWMLQKPCDVIDRDGDRSTEEVSARRTSCPNQRKLIWRTVKAMIDKREHLLGRVSVQAISGERTNSFEGSCYSSGK